MCWEPRLPVGHLECDTLSASPGRCQGRGAEARKDPQAEDVSRAVAPWPVACALRTVAFPVLKGEARACGWVSVTPAAGFQQRTGSVLCLLPACGLRRSPRRWGSVGVPGGLTPGAGGCGTRARLSPSWSLRLFFGIRRWHHGWLSGQQSYFCSRCDLAFLRFSGCKCVRFYPQETGGGQG